MSFISYAQNCEDVILHRALKHIRYGFYIDIGAQDPVEYSVTKAFYELGWHGINIEPVAHWFEKLIVDRPRDINLQLAAAEKPGTLHFYEILNTGLSTSSAEFAQRHTEKGFSVHEVDVDCVTLDEICERNAVETVHFLKIDCEGSEASVLRGFSFSRWRPWIVLVEATEPLSQEPTHMEWESLIVERDYHLIYKDGLNRFYVANEHAELGEAFSYPPNVFDEFVRAAELFTRNELEAARGDLSSLREALSFGRLQAQLEFLNGENKRRETALVEHRRMLEDASQREALSAERLRAERDQSRNEIEFLRNENERREGALIEYRRLLDEAVQREVTNASYFQAEQAQWQSNLEHLRNENERRESALAEHLRLLAHVSLRAAELDRLYASRSFRWTSPLRRLASRLRNVPPYAARVGRPVWRNLIKYSWGRKICIVIFYPIPRLRNRINVSIAAYTRDVESRSVKILSPAASEIHLRLKESSRNSKLSKKV